MKTQIKHRIIELLLEHSDGLTGAELQKLCGTSRSPIDVALKALRNYCVYIDRYEPCSGSRKYAGVFVLATKPDDCPWPE
jgi:hypothetical protein